MVIDEDEQVFVAAAGRDERTSDIRVDDAAGVTGRGALAVAQAWHGPMAARRSVDGASEVMSGRERRRLSPACSRRCMYPAARLGGMA
eukprot:4908820-Pleurochrysis_carterae.AAC.3